MTVSVNVLVDQSHASPPRSSGRDPDRARGGRPQHKNTGAEIRSIGAALNDTVTVRLAHAHAHPTVVTSDCVIFRIAMERMVHRPPFRLTATSRILRFRWRDRGAFVRQDARGQGLELHAVRAAPAAAAAVDLAQPLAHSGRQLPRAAKDRLQHARVKQMEAMCHRTAVASNGPLRIVRRAAMPPPPPPWPPPPWPPPPWPPSPSAASALVGAVVLRDHAEEPEHQPRRAAEHKRGEEDDARRRGHDRPLVGRRRRAREGVGDRAAQPGEDEEDGVAARERALPPAEGVGEGAERRDDDDARKRHDGDRKGDEAALASSTPFSPRSVSKRSSTAPRCATRSRPMYMKTKVSARWANDLSVSSTARRPSRESECTW